MIKINNHSSIKIIDKKIIYIDPFKIEESLNDADIVFFTHDHYDHYSKEDIDKVINEKTILIAPKSCNIDYPNEQLKVLPNNEYKIQEIEFKTIPSYNIDKKYHPKENDWVGYTINLNSKMYYIAGDTDLTLESKQIKCDIALIPIGGTYTMNYAEAAELINIIKPKIAIPTHYGCITGTKEDAIKFCGLVNPNIKCIVLIEE